MKWFARLLASRKPAASLSPELRESLAHWHALPRPDLSRTHRETRYVVLNTHASGLDPDHDRLLSIAAIAIDGGKIDPRSSFHAGLERDQDCRLAALLAFVGNGPVVVFNAPLNRRLIERALQDHLGVTPDWLWLDLYWLLPSLFGEVSARPMRLARWMESLNLGTFQRFHALGDAWVLAKLLLALQSRARREERRSPHSLADLEASLRAVADR